MYMESAANGIMPCLWKHEISDMPVVVPSGGKIFKIRIIVITASNSIENNMYMRYSGGVEEIGLREPLKNSDEVLR